MLKKVMPTVNITRICALVAFLIVAPSVFAGSGTWLSSPASNNWNSGANWSSATVPNGSSDTATFATSSTTGISIIAATEVNGIVFNSGASAYTITVSPNILLNISGAGITNSSGVIQNFVAAATVDGWATIFFTNSATAGSMATYTNTGSPVNSITHSGLGFGITNFVNTSTAGSASFVNNGGTVLQGFGGQTVFNDSSTAANGTFTNNGGAVAGSAGGNTLFADKSTAANGTFINNGSALSNAGGGYTTFINTSTAGAATLIANAGTGSGQGGVIFFADNSTGGTSRVEVFGNGTLDITLMSTTGVTIGSLEGDGKVALNNKILTVGSNDMSTIFSGVIGDSGFGGGLTKIGAGTLTLSGANTYTGATTVNAGTLLVDGSITSNVTVNNGGTLGGAGTVQSILVNSGATLAPGTSPGILFATGNLTLTLGSTYLVELNGTAVGTAYDQTEVVGTVTLGNATLSLSLGFAPTLGTQFMIISNALSDAVVGQFNGLPEGTTVTSDGTTFMISYVGGNGNDVVLTVVPEPFTSALVATGAGLLFAFRRRR